MMNDVLLTSQETDEAPEEDETTRLTVVCVLTTRVWHFQRYLSYLLATTMSNCLFLHLFSDISPLYFPFILLQIFITLLVPLVAHPFHLTLV